MRQANYETIIRCIQYGAPAIAEQLITDLNNTCELANKQLTQMQAEEIAAREKAQAAAKRKQGK